MERFPFSDNNKRYHTLSCYNRRTFGQKIYKASLDAGFSCPNRDGTKGTAGCAFCAGRSGYFTHPGTIEEQLAKEQARIAQKAPDALLCAYFQAGTNTYAPLPVLRDVFFRAIRFPGVKALAIATRPDCLPPPVCALLAELQAQLPVTVELGLQTVHDRTAENFGRGYPFSVFVSSMQELKKIGIRTCVHIIDGLLGEDREQMLQTAQILGRMEPDAVKIQLLHVIASTPLADVYRAGGYTPLSFSAYTKLAAEQLLYFPPQTVIERLTGDADKTTLLAPAWSRDKIRVLGTIDHILQQNEWMQGQRFSPVDPHEERSIL